MTGYMVQPILAIPQGGHAPARGAIVQSIATMQNLLEQQTGHRLRVAKKIVVVHVPIRGRLITNPTAQLAALNVSIPCGPNTIDAVFYANPWLDAFGDWPPLVQGHVAVVAMGAGPELVGPLMLHEVFHAMGLVPVGAVHSDGRGHVTDSDQDLMTGSGGVLSLLHPVIDVGHDDYWDLLLASPYLV